MVHSYTIFAVTLHYIPVVMSNIALHVDEC